jgi:hypothetical protein
VAPQFQHFAGDIDSVKARVMFAVQQALSASTLQDVMGVPAWKSHPPSRRMPSASSRSGWGDHGRLIETAAEAVRAAG